MAGVTKSQIEAAKEIDLLTYLTRNEPGSLKKTSANEFCLKEHDSLKISNGLWHWHTRHIGGKTALDFLIKVRGMDFVDAVKRLTDGMAVQQTADTRAPAAQKSLSPQVNSPKQPDNKDFPAKNLPPKPPFALPPANKCGTAAIRYLQSRGIDNEIISKCVSEKRIFECENKQFRTKNCVFVGFNAQNEPKYAFLRGTSGNFKQEQTGSSKKYGFSIPAQGKSETLSVFESPIDALSGASIAKMIFDEKGKPGQWQNVHRLSLGGTSPLALNQYLQDHPEIKKINLCLDDDPAGREACEKLSAMLEQGEIGNAKGGYEVRITPPKPPEGGKDYNDMLLAALAARRAATAQNAPTAAKNEKSA